MDPEACLQAMLTAITDGELELAAERAADLAEWLRKGGFKPALPGLNPKLDGQTVGAMFSDTALVLHVLHRRKEGGS